MTSVNSSEGHAPRWGGPLARRLVPDEYLDNRRSHGAQRLICGGKFAINWQDGENLCRRFGFGTQNNTGLAAPGERGERTMVPVAHRGGVVPAAVWAPEDGTCYPACAARGRA